MGQVESEAVILRTYDLAEADKIVVCFTREAGLVRAVARGARRLKSRYGAGLEPFTLVQLSYYEKEGRELVSLRQLEIRRSYFTLAVRVETITTLAYMSELVLAFAPPHEPNERMYRMVCACLEATKSSLDDLVLIQLYFEVWLLRLTGFFSVMRKCARCDSSFGEQAKMFLYGEMQQLCGACSKGLGTHISEDLRAQLLSIQRQSPEDFVKSARLLDTQTRRELLQITRRIISQVLERDLQGGAALPL